MMKVIEQTTDGAKTVAMLRATAYPGRYRILRLLVKREACCADE